MYHVMRGYVAGVSWFRLLCFPAECVCTQLGSTGGKIGVLSHSYQVDPYICCILLRRVQKPSQPLFSTIERTQSNKPSKSAKQILKLAFRF
jgi:hypothetical protein